MGSFIDTLGRLTDEQSARIAKEAHKHELEQHRLAMEDMDRLHREDVLKAKELELLEQKMSKRRETLNMSWLGAELLKATGISKQNWIDTAPKFQTKGLFIRRQELSGRQERFAFDAWELEDLKESSSIYRHFYASEQTKLVLTNEGEIGVAKTKRHMYNEAENYVQFRFQDRNRSVRFGLASSVSASEQAKLEADYLASEELCEKNELEILPHNCTSESEALIHEMYVTEARRESWARQNAVYDRFDRIGLKGRIGELLIDALTYVEDKQEEKMIESTTIDEHMRISLANLLAVNGIKIL